MSVNSWMDKLAQYPAVRRLKTAVTEPVSRPIWWTIQGEKPRSLDYSDACRTCRFVRHPAQRKVCQKQFLAALDAARQRRSSHRFICPIRRHAVVLPVVHDDQVKGYFAMCNSEPELPKVASDLAALSLEETVRDLDLGQELKNLSEAIQPRCVALSTIHTIHRLISSTLDIRELLPRIARLCCQVLRAQSCTIWLVDPERKLLIPRAGIELQKGHRPRPAIIKIGFGVAGKVASTLVVKVTKKMMAVPLVEEECIGVIMVQRRGKTADFATLDQEILTTLAEQAVVAIRNAQMYETQERVTWGTIRSLSDILSGMDASDVAGGVPHGYRMANIAVAIGQEMKVPTSLLRSLQYAALLHDAGRLGIPQEILKKTTKLDAAELAKIREHTVRGARLLEPMEILEPAIPIILYHHERYDGTGYPKGLKKEEIPLGARILAVANAFEAMICDRPYRRALPVAKAAQEIASLSGTQFDPEIVKAFLSLERDKKLEKLVRLPSFGMGDNGAA